VPALKVSKTQAFAGIGLKSPDVKGRPQPLLCTEQAEKIRARDVPAPKIILHNKDLRILSHAIAAESLNISPLRVVGDPAHRGA
jgi:hypothetical protein